MPATAQSQAGITATSRPASDRQVKVPPVKPPAVLIVKSVFYGARSPRHATLARPSPAPSRLPGPHSRPAPPRPADWPRPPRHLAPALLPQSPEPTPAQKIVAFKEAFWKFLRPHTIRGTILGSSAVTAIALLENTAVRGPLRLPGPPAGCRCFTLPPVPRSGPP